MPGHRVGPLCRPTPSAPSGALQARPLGDHRALSPSRHEPRSRLCRARMRVVSVRPPRINTCQAHPVRADCPVLCGVTRAGRSVSAPAGEG